MNWFAKRMREPSSWAGIGTLISSIALAWATKSPEAIGAAVAGIAAFVMPENASD